MKKYIYNISLLAVLFLTVTACTKEDAVLDSSAVEKEQPVIKTYTMTVNASKGEDVATTRALSLDGTTLNSTWAVNEEVTVYNVTKSADLGGTLKAQSAGANTTLSGTLTGTIEKNDVLTLKFHSPSYASQDGTLEYIAANCDYATANVTVSTVVGGNVTTDAAHFVNQQAIVKFTLKDKNGGALLEETTKLAITVGSNSYTITPASPTSELFVAIPAFSGQITLNAIVGTKVYTYTKTGVTFTNSQYYTIGVKMTHQGTIEIGKVIGQNGCIYADANAATDAGTTAVARIAYVGNESNCQHGLAIQLNNSSDASFTGAQTAASALEAVPGCSWRIPTKEDWQYMFIRCAASGDTTTKETSMQVNGFISTITNIPVGTTLWTSSPSGSSGYKVYFSKDLGNNNWAEFQPDTEGQPLAYRAVLAF